MSPMLSPHDDYMEIPGSWFGRVPCHWQVKPARAVFRPRQELNKGLVESTVLSLSYGRIVVKPAEKLHGLVPESFETYQLISPGDIIVRATDLQNDRKSLRVGLARDRGIITSAYMCLRCSDDVLPEYGYQVLNALDRTKHIYGYGSGLRQNLDFSHIKSIPIPVPPLDEQKAIVAFLEEFRRCIHRRTFDNRRMVSLIDEQIDVAADDAVRSGMAVGRSTKPSGVPWLGDIPQNWSVLRARFLFREVDERSVDGHETHLSMSQKLGLVPSALVDQTLLSESYAGGKLCLVGDLVLNRLKAHLGVFAVATQDGVISPDYTVLRPVSPMDVRYFERVLRSNACRGELRKRAKGIVEGFWRLYTDDFYDIRLPVPPLDEQSQIADYLEAQREGRLRAANIMEREDALLEELHIRMVADLVAGRLDARGVSMGVQEWGSDTGDTSAPSEEGVAPVGT